VTYQLGGVCNSVTLAASPASPQNIGTTVTLTGTATCTLGATPEYKYFYQPGGTSVWTLIKDWSTTTASWNTAALTNGLYNLRVFTRAVGNTSGNEGVGYK